ncbi:YceI family protein [Pedobacter montanisoli]|uniref:YceI family protein n=1 Tax=Pedobacter montanisoli TaxID=2923277 RepID=A0ABS9ZTN9_9SPHI|nr:YceI family protein [Pedobacter montanisoli]MCJ0741946.1 YceI family protein [Pedobacter montanisoli]
MATIKWSLDPSHSELQFKVKHLMISTVTGDFKSFSADLISDDENFENIQVDFKADMSSIDTRNQDRDNHLKSGDFFDVEKYPEMTFKSTSVTKDDDDFVVTGDLTIKGTTKEVKLKAELGGVNTDPWGNTKAGFTINGKINRGDFGLTWNAALETGGVMVSDEVKILGELQFVKQA